MKQMKKLNNKQNKILFWLVFFVWIAFVCMGTGITAYLIDGGYLFDSRWGQLGIILYWMLVGACGVYIDKLRPICKK